jgi:hypothetical protein
MAAQGGADRGGRDPDAKAQQRLRLDQEAGPAGSGQHAADRGQQRAVGGLELGPWDLATEDAELVANTIGSRSLAASPRASSTSWMERHSMR